METLIHEASSLHSSTSDKQIKNNHQWIPVNDNNDCKIINIGSQKEDHELTEIVFENLYYTVSAGFQKGKKEILHGINGRFPRGQLICIMGPSGAGKSTLLDILSGYRLTGIKGSFFINGKPRKLDLFRRTSAYITQDDRLQPLLTILENMQIAANLKLGTDVPWHKKNKIIEEILTTLGLIDHVKTRASRLSGGQQKRLSIALELVNNPTVMFLDEPTTGLDSSTCTQVVSLLKVLALQGRTIVCTIHQPSASLFQQFDQVYVLAKGNCLYQGATDQLVTFLEGIKLPCPMYHNPADYIIELACGEYGDDKIDTLIKSTENGKSLQYFKDSETLIEEINSGKRYPNFFDDDNKSNSSNEKKITSLQATSPMHQLKVLLYRGYIKCKRDSGHTHLRLAVNILTGIMLGSLFIKAGNDGNRVRENYNLLFGILMHHMMTSMMLTILTFPTEMNILKKEHFNRWYSLKMFYTSVTLIDIPVSFVCCFVFTIIIYFMSSQPLDLTRFSMFFAISLLIVFVAQGIGLLIGSIFNVVNGTFVGPTMSVPMMMFAGFGVTLKDMPHYLKWGTYISYLRYGLEGYVGAIYGLNRPNLDCEDSEIYCLYKSPQTFLNEITMEPDQFWNDIIGLVVILIIVRFAAYYFLRWKLMASR